MIMNSLCKTQRFRFPSNSQPFADFVGICWKRKSFCATGVGSGQTVPCVTISAPIRTYSTAGEFCISTMPRIWSACSLGGSETGKNSGFQHCITNIPNMSVKMGYLIPSTSFKPKFETDPNAQISQGATHWLCHNPCCWGWLSPFFRGVDLNASVRFTFASWRSHVMTISPQFPQCLLLLLFATVCSFELCSNAWLVFLGCDVWLC